MGQHGSVVFQPFMAFQGSTRAGGTGLGMSIAAELMRAHGGTIQVSSSGPQGTTIMLRLPPCESKAINSIRNCDQIPSTTVLPTI